MQIKIREKQPKKNLEIPIILLYYYNILQKSAGCHLFLRMKRQHKKKRPRNHCGAFSEKPIKKNPNDGKNTYIFIKRLSRKLSGQFSKRIGSSPSKSSENGTCFIWNVTTIRLYVRKFRNPSLGATLSLVNVTCIPSFAFESILLKLSFITLSPFVDTKVRKIFGICNSLPKKMKKKCGGKIWIIR